MESDMEPDKEPHVEVVDIRIENIREAPYLELLSYGRDYDWLTGSVASRGLLTPPVVRPEEGGIFHLVCGRARLEALRSLGATNVPAMIRTDLDDSKAFEIAVDDNVQERGFNDVEKAGAVHFILKVLKPDEEKADALLRRLPVPVNPRTLSRYLKLYEAPRIMKQMIVRGDISFNTFVLVSGLGPEDAGALLKVISELKPNTNYQRDLVITCEDLSAMLEKTIAEVLAMNEVRQVLENDRLSRPDRIKHLFRVLRKKPADEHRR